MRSLLRHLVVLSLFLPVAACGGSDEESADTDGNAESAASIDGDTELAGRLEPVVAERADDGPGCGIGADVGGERGVATFGLADVDEEVDISEETVFDLASVSKQFTGAAITLLAQREELDLSDTVGDHLDGMSADVAGVTVAQLLTHSSGIPDYFEGLSEDGLDDEIVTQAQVAERIGAFEVESAPGEEFDYVNSNYVLLAEIVESVSGEDFADFLETEFFGPAGMASTFVHDYVTEVPALAVSYEDDEPVFSRWQQRGDGAVHSTVGDVLRWGRYLLETGAELREAMMATTFESGDGGVYGAGLIETEAQGMPVLTHTGLWLGFDNEFGVFPDDDMVVVTLCNGVDVPGDDLFDEVVAAADAA